MDLSVVRQRLEDRERLPSPYAAKSFEPDANPEAPSPVRTEFQRDRDRILHCKAFRRLKHKTKAFIAPVGDHFVTRLTHLPRSPKSRARARGLNSTNLAEAMALAHDIGHRRSDTQESRRCPNCCQTGSGTRNRASGRRKP